MRITFYPWLSLEETSVCMFVLEYKKDQFFPKTRCILAILAFLNSTQQVYWNIYIDFENIWSKTNLMSHDFTASLKRNWHREKPLSMGQCTPGAFLNCCMQREHSSTCSEPGQVSASHCTAQSKSFIVIAFCLKLFFLIATVTTSL